MDTKEKERKKIGLIVFTHSRVKKEEYETVHCSISVAGLLCLLELVHHVRPECLVTKWIEQA